MVDLYRYSATLQEGNFIEQIKANIFLQTALQRKPKSESKYNLEAKDNSRVSKEDFLSEIQAPIYASIIHTSAYSSIAPEYLTDQLQ